jgi:hypothetical protein
MTVAMGLELHFSQWGKVIWGALGRSFYRGKG